MKLACFLIFALRIKLSSLASVSKVGNYEDFKDKIYELTSTEGNIFVVFLASWCSDCVRAEPLLAKSIAEAPWDSKFLYVDIGDYSSWRDRDNRFRTDRATRLERLPTLVKWGTDERLVEDQLMDESLIREMLELSI